MQKIGDFYRNFQISILTRGYQNWQNGEANLLITRGLVGRLSNTPNVGFAYQINNVSEYLVSRRVRALPGRRYSAQDDHGRNWIVRQPRVDIPMVPTELQTSNLLDGRISVSFRNYIPAPEHTSNIPDDGDESEVGSETILILTEEESNDDEGAWQYMQYLAVQSAQPPNNSGQEDSGPNWDTENEDDDENDWINPFSEGGGQKKTADDTVFMINEAEGPFDYPQFKNLSAVMAEHAFTSSSSAVSHYQPPPDQSMHMPSYPPARGTREARPTPTFEERVPRAGRFRGGYNNEMWTLPSAQQQQGAMFVIPEQLGLFHDAFSRWESITRNHVAEKGFTDPRDKIEYMENLLGEVEKLTWVQWRM